VQTVTAAEEEAGRGERSGGDRGDEMMRKKSRRRKKTRYHLREGRRQENQDIDWNRQGGTRRWTSSGRSSSASQSNQTIQDEGNTRMRMIDGGREGGRGRRRRRRRRKKRKSTARPFSVFF